MVKNNIKNSIKTKLKNERKTLLNRYEYNIQESPKGLIFTFKDLKVPGEKYLIIKHRQSKKRLSKKITKNQVIIDNKIIEELLKLIENTENYQKNKNIYKNENSEIFDIYIRDKVWKYEFLIRINVKHRIDNLNLKNKSDIILTPYKTKNSNLSFRLCKTKSKTQNNPMKNTNITKTKSKSIKLNNLFNITPKRDALYIFLMKKEEIPEDLKIIIKKRETKEIFYMDHLIDKLTFKIKWEYFLDKGSSYNFYIQMNNKNIRLKEEFTYKFKEMKCVKARIYKTKKDNISLKSKLKKEL
ncbi:MAG: hypothetical protein LBM96_08520 [Methanobrevibacter sp.]|jgi:hypothetical protein|nr:hypothetical protein [Candidatus Methanoflexus mossambicus]